MFVPEDVFPSIARYTISSRDIYISIVGTVGLVGVVDQELDGASLTENAAKICDIAAHVNRDYLYAFLRSGWGQHQIRTLTVGSTQPKLALFRIADIRVPLPPLHEQHAIAHILGTLDDKIELNRRMNATLEEMARALFKSWFVDFDPVRAKIEGRDTGLPREIADLFPDGFEESELGVVPKGWRVGTIRDCCTKIENGGTPLRSEPKYWQPATVPWLTSGEVRQSIVIGTDNMISEEGLAHSSAKMWSSGTTVVALYGATAGQVCLLAEEMCANQACCGLVPAESMRSYLYLGASSSVASLELQARGSAQQNLSQQIVADFRILVAAGSMMKAFEDLLSPIFEHWILNLHESRTLAALRDALLPKLISGEVRVPDAERMIDHAV